MNIANLYLKPSIKFKSRSQGLDLILDTLCWVLESKFWWPGNLLLDVVPLLDLVEADSGRLCSFVDDPHFDLYHYHCHHHYHYYYCNEYFYHYYYCLYSIDVESESHLLLLAGRDPLHWQEAGTHPHLDLHLNNHWNNNICYHHRYYHDFSSCMISTSHITLPQLVDPVSW